eukprot:TRINITY_DN411_c1_g3_i1.p1 TRINITY_DN411_c1_g3~~TRINITY_DN411_c1_g3_i1.p1  ORF type:complete len:314 (+),score=54.55 TRINITY_DN411_c1_g3_i1:68-1009(+)
MTSGISCIDFMKRLLTFCVACSCVACFVGCIFLIDTSLKAEDEDANDREKGFSVMTYIFYMIISLILFLVEWEPLWMFNYALFLHYWPGRGMTQIYLGTLLLHAATTIDQKHDGTMGLESSKLKTVIEVFGWCLVGCGGIYLLLGLCCLRGENDVASRLRGDGQEKSEERKYRDQQELPVAAGTSTQHLTLLRTMQASGVPHLDQAISSLVETLESQKKAEPRGVTGWLKKKFSKKEKGTKEERQDFNSVVSGGREADPSQMYGTSPAPGFSNQPPMAPPQSSRTMDDDIHRRRQEEDDALEREYMRRTAQNY